MSQSKQCDTRSDHYQNKKQIETAPYAQKSGLGERGMRNLNTNKVFSLKLFHTDVIILL